MSDSSRPHGLQPTRLLRPWDFLGKSTGVGCHCLLRYSGQLCSIVTLDTELANAELLVLGDIQGYIPVRIWSQHHSQSINI